MARPSTSRQQSATTLLSELRSQAATSDSNGSSSALGFTPLDEALELVGFGLYQKWLL
jgi:hypothetical protein